MSDPITRLNTALEGRYRIERELGEGGMATVYLARDQKHNRNVALKVLKPELAAALGHERFLKEIEVTANLNHPHILPLHDSGEASGFLYYVMPYVEGESLRDRLDRDRELPVDESLSIAKAVGTALDYAHRRGIVHRDIKPRNILLQDGQPLIADFGIAFAVSAAGGDRLTLTGLSIGTPQYMSPEQAAADRPVDGRTDVYALGCVLFEMLTGEPPFTASSPGALLARKLTDTAPDVSTVRETVSRPVAIALRRALARTPADRFQTAADFTRALGDTDELTALALDPAESTVPHRAPAFARSAVALALMILGALVGALAVTLLTEPPATPRVSLAVPLGGREVATGNFRSLTISPDGAHLAVLVMDSVDRRLYLKPMDGVARPIEGSEGAMNPTFSPDSRSLAYFTRDAIWRVDVDGGSPVRIRSSSGAVIGATWTSDDLLVFTAGYRGGLSAVAAGGEGDVRELTQLEGAESSHRYAHAVVGTTRLLVFVAGEGGQVWLFDTESGERVPLTDGSYPRYANGILFFERDGTLFGWRLDPISAALEGDAVPLVQGVEGSSYDVSETGTLVYVQDGSRGVPLSRLARLDAFGGQTLVTPEIARFGRPVVSPDGARVAVGVSGPRELRVYDLALGGYEVVDTSFGWSALWSPDSNALLYGSGEMVRYELTTGERRDFLTQEPDRRSPIPVAWSGRDLLFTAIGTESGSEGDLWRMRASGEVEPLRKDESVTWQADVRPEDGRFAFAEGPTVEDRRIHVAAPDARSSVQISGFGAAAPRWAPDAIYFRERSALVRVPTDANGNPVPDMREIVLPSVEGFDVHPDGESLIVTMPLPSPPAELLVETGWLASVRALLR